MNAEEWLEKAIPLLKERAELIENNPGDKWITTKEKELHDLGLQVSQKVRKQEIEIGFTGTSEKTTVDQIDSLKELLSIWARQYELTGHHGDCIEADEQFHRIFHLYHKFYTIIHPPINEGKRAFCDLFDNLGEIRQPKEYLARNLDIVKEVTRLIALPSTYEEIVRSGTWATIRAARKKGRDIYIIYPNGVIEHEKRDNK